MGSDKYDELLTLLHKFWERMHDSESTGFHRSGSMSWKVTLTERFKTLLGILRNDRFQMNPHLNEVMELTETLVKLVVMRDTLCNIDWFSPNHAVVSRIESVCHTCLLRIKKKYEFDAKVAINMSKIHFEETDVTDLKVYIFQRLLKQVLLKDEYFSEVFYSSDSYQYKILDVHRRILGNIKVLCMVWKKCEKNSTEKKKRSVTWLNKVKEAFNNHTELCWAKLLWFYHWYLPVEEKDDSCSEELNMEEILDSEKSKQIFSDIDKHKKFSELTAQRLNLLRVYLSLLILYKYRIVSPHEKVFQYLIDVAFTANYIGTKKQILDMKPILPEVFTLSRSLLVERFHSLFDSLYRYWEQPLPTDQFRLAQLSFIRRQASYPVMSQMLGIYNIMHQYWKSPQKSIRSTMKPQQLQSMSSKTLAVLLKEIRSMITFVFDHSTPEPRETLKDMVRKSSSLKKEIPYMTGVGNYTDTEVSEFYSILDRKQMSLVTALKKSSSQRERVNQMLTKSQKMASDLSNSKRTKISLEGGSGNMNDMVLDQILKLYYLVVSLQSSIALRIFGPDDTVLKDMVNRSKSLINKFKNDYVVKTIVERPLRCDGDLEELFINYFTYLKKLKRTVTMRTKMYDYNPVNFSFVIKYSIKAAEGMLGICSKEMNFEKKGTEQFVKDTKEEFQSIFKTIRVYLNKTGLPNKVSTDILTNIRELYHKIDKAQPILVNELGSWDGFVKRNIALNSNG